MPRSNKTLASSINSSRSDVKAEVIIAELMDGKIRADQVITRLNGAFGRNHSRDVRRAVAGQGTDILVLNVMRDGLYDLLPEGLFHDLVNYSTMDLDQRKIEFERQRQIENNARSFFLPLDNELSLIRAMTELAILKFYRDPFPGLKRLALDEPSVPEKYYRSFISLIPFSSQIKGDLELTASSLAEILNKKVTARSFYLLQNQSIDRERLKGTYHKRLGEDLLCSDHFPESTLCWEFSIHLDDDTDLPDYADIEKGFVKRLLDKFYDIFVPFEIRADSKFICNMKIPFILGRETGSSPEMTGEDVRPAFLGFNIAI